MDDFLYNDLFSLGSTADLNEHPPLFFEQFIDNTIDPSLHTVDPYTEYCAPVNQDFLPVAAGAQAAANVPSVLTSSSASELASSACTTFTYPPSEDYAYSYQDLTPFSEGNPEIYYHNDDASVSGLDFTSDIPSTGTLPPANDLFSDFPAVFTPQYIRSSAASEYVLEASGMSHPVSVATTEGTTDHLLQTQTEGKKKEKSFLCDVCLRAFNRNSNMKSHRETHILNRIKPFVCLYKGCGHAFSRKHDRKRHVESRHIGSGKPTSRESAASTGSE